MHRKDVSLLHGSSCFPDVFFCL